MCWDVARSGAGVRAGVWQRVCWLGLQPPAGPVNHRALLPAAPTPDTQHFSLRAAAVLHKV
jgi:hypothetical protein